MSLACATLCCASIEARAQVNDNCSNTSECLTASNSSTGMGIRLSGGGIGIYSSTSGVAIWGDTGNGSAAAVFGSNSGSGIPIVGDSQGTAVGIEGSATDNHGIYGYTSGYPYAGVYGRNANTSGGWGVRGDAIDSGTGVYGSNTNTSGFAGYFDGSLKVTGTPHRR